MKYVICSRLWTNAEKSILAVCDTKDEAIRLISELEAHATPDVTYWYEVVPAF